MHKTNLDDYVHGQVFFPKQNTTIVEQALEDIAGEKGVNYRSSSSFSRFPTVFSTLLEYFLPFSSNLKLPSANFFSLEE